MMRQLKGRITKHRVAKLGRAVLFDYPCVLAIWFLT